jgi:hypothetical protein
MAVVKTETFTTASTQDLETYDSDWVHVGGSLGSGDIRVEATNDRAESGQATFSTTIGVYRWDGTGSPTGDQQVEFDGFCWAGYPGAALRASSVADTAYACILVPVADTGLRIYRRVAGTNTLVAASTAVTIADQTLYSGVTARVEGSGATVTVTLTVPGETPLVFNDTDGARLTSGQPGIYIEHNAASGNRPYMDNVVIDDLASAPPSTGIGPLVGSRLIGSRFIGSPFIGP